MQTKIGQTESLNYIKTKEEGSKSHKIQLGYKQYTEITKD